MSLIAVSLMLADLKFELRSSLFSSKSRVLASCRSDSSTPKRSCVGKLLVFKRFLYWAVTESGRGMEEMGDNPIRVV